MVFRWPSATHGRRLCGMILDYRVPNVMAEPLGDDDTIPKGDPALEYLVQFGESALWVRGWAIVPADSVVYKSDPDGVSDDDDLE